MRTVVVAAFAVALAGCGRFGFDSGKTGDGGDGAIDAPALQCDGAVCNELSPSWTPQWSHVLAYWSFDAPAAGLNDGDSVSAEVGTATTAKNANGVGMGYAPGRLGNALQLDLADGAHDNYLLAADNASYSSLAQFSIAAWVYDTELPGAVDSNDTEILAKKVQAIDNAAAEPWVIWELGTKNASFITSVSSAAAGSYITLNSLTQITLNTWYHVVGTWDGSTLRLYVNGTLDASMAAALTMGATFVDPVVGAFRSQNYGTEQFRGLIDELALWNVALSPAEVATIYARQ